MRGRWNDSIKESVRRKADARRQRELAIARVRENALAWEAKIQKSLTAKTRSITEQWVDQVIENSDLSFRLVLRAVTDRAPRLIEQSMLKGLQQLSKLPFLREPTAWKPRGKGRETLFRSLCEHLFASFPMPPFLWSAFFEDDAESFSLFVAHVASGGSVYDGVKERFLPIPLTRKMCHDLMQTSADVGFLRALRRVQVRTSGGSDRFLQAWMATQAGSRLHSAVDEAFWMTVVEWFAKNPMADPEQVGPLVDYIGFRRRQDEAFSMKGRSILALMRAMTEWHAELAKEKVIHGSSFRPSGFRPLSVEKKYRDRSGNSVQETWNIDELLSSKALAEEGKKLAHCVYSYAHSIERGTTSIWSLSMQSFEAEEKQKMMTIEVRNDVRRIVQFRGRFNREATAREFGVLNEWAGMNRLEIRLGRW